MKVISEIAKKIMGKTPLHWTDTFSNLSKCKSERCIKETENLFSGAIENMKTHRSC